MKILKQLIFWLITLNILTYLIFSQSSTDKIASKEYINFTKKRLQNKWIKDTTEVIILASCGDEFFRNKKIFQKTIGKSNSRNKKINDTFHPYSFWKSDYYNIEPFIEISKHTDSLKSKCCIVYKLCSEKTIPLLIKKINFEYFYSDSDTDYHIMFHNSQMEMKNITYFWFFGIWVPIKTENKTYDYYIRK